MASDETSFFLRLREARTAQRAQDPSEYKRYLADTYVFTGPDGTVENKAQAIADLKSGDLKLQSASLDNAKVQVYGDTAIVTYSSNDKGTYKGPVRCILVQFHGWIRLPIERILLDPMKAAVHQQELVAVNEL